MARITVHYFSDVLCIWAYVSQARLDEARANFGERVDFDMRFCSVFPDAHAKIRAKWGAEDGFSKFNAHLQEVAERFPHVELHKDIWTRVRPHTSSAAHLFLKGVELAAEEGGEGEARVRDAIWAIRRAFFAEARDISSWGVQEQVVRDLGLDASFIEEKIRSGEAMARLDADLKLRTEMGVEGSPTFVMNEGRQKLFGNVGYRLIEANLEELLRRPASDEASWC